MFVTKQYFIYTVPHQTFFKTSSRRKKLMQVQNNTRVRFKCRSQTQKRRRCDLKACVILFFTSDDEDGVTWHMNCGITLWKMEPLYPKPCSPVHRALKFSVRHTKDQTWEKWERNHQYNVFVRFTCCFGHNIRVQLKFRNRVKGQWLISSWKDNYKIFNWKMNKFNFKNICNIQNFSEMCYAF